MTVAARVSPMRRLAVRLRRWARRIHLYRKLAFALAVVAVLAGIATVVPWTGVSEYGPDPDNVLYLQQLFCRAQLGPDDVVNKASRHPVQFIMQFFIFFSQARHKLFA